VSVLASRLATPIASSAAPARRPINNDSTAGLSTPSRAENATAGRKIRQSPVTTSTMAMAIKNSLRFRGCIDPARLKFSVGSDRTAPLAAGALRTPPARSLPPNGTRRCKPSALRETSKLPTAHRTKPHSNILFKTAILSTKALLARESLRRYGNLVASLCAGLRRRVVAFHGVVCASQTRPTRRPISGALGRGAVQRVRYAGGFRSRDSSMCGWPILTRGFDGSQRKNSTCRRRRPACWSVPSQITVRMQACPNP
jgi:hypothetical protein